MKRSDLFREYARVIDMCEPMGALPFNCVKQNGGVLGSAPRFDSPPDGYTFAIGICEGKPVFAGDILYTSNGGKWFVGIANVHEACADGSWTKPDPYAELKKALADGKVIQFLCGSVWVDLVEEEITLYKVYFLRVKPEPVVETRTIGVNIKSAGNGNLIECTWTDGILTNVEIVK